MPAVSVIVPVYKVEEYIERCARALFGQTMEDLEFIFVDDCTPDASMDILARVLDDYPQRRGRVTILHNEVNRGLPFTRRRGVEVATGDYIIHCDSDDWPEPDMYAKLYAKAREENLDMVMCQNRIVYPDHTELCWDKLGYENPIGALIRQDILNHVWDKLVTRKAYEKGVVFPAYNMLEDTALIIQLAFNCETFGYVYEPLYNYFYRESSLINGKDSARKMYEMLGNLNLAFSCLEAKGLAKEYKKDILQAKCWLKDIAKNIPRDSYFDPYPEVNFAYIFNRHFPLKHRLGHVTDMLGIHGISKVFKRRER